MAVLEWLELTVHGESRCNLLVCGNLYILIQHLDYLHIDPVTSPADFGTSDFLRLYRPVPTR